MDSKFNIMIPTPQYLLPMLRNDFQDAYWDENNVPRYFRISYKISNKREDQEYKDGYKIYNFEAHAGVAECVNRIQDLQLLLFPKEDLFVQSHDDVNDSGTEPVYLILGFHAGKN